MFSKHSTGIIYIERKSFSYYFGSNTPVTFLFPTASFQELEITNEEAFLKEAGAFIIKNKLTVANAIIIISPDLLYEKEFIDEQPQQRLDPHEHPEPMDPTKPIQSVVPSSQRTLASHEERLRQIGLFTESVPFEDTASKIYKIDKGVKVVVTNKRLFQTIKTAFTRQGFVVEAIVPMSMLGKDFGTPSGMNDELIKKLFLHYETIKGSNLLQEDPSAMATPTAPGHIQMTTKVTSRREYVLIGVFVLLMVALGIVVYMTFFTSQKPPADVSAVTEQVSPPVIPNTPAPTIPIATSSAVASTAAVLDKTVIRITISGASATQSNGLKQVLTSDGFTKVTIKTTAVPSNGKVLIIFSSVVPQAVRELFLADVKKVSPNVAAQENSLVDTDILVNL